MYPFEAEKKKLEKLVKEYNSLNLNSNQVEFSDDLSEKFDEIDRIAEYWKDYYKYSSNDKRFITATMTQIYQDYLMIKLREFKGIYGSPVKEKYEDFMKEIEKDCAAIRNCKDNYISKEEREKQNQEDKEFYEKVRLLTREQISELSAEEQIRFENIKQRLLVVKQYYGNGRPRKPILQTKI